MNPGPGSTFKPIVFSAIASQLNLDWDAFAAEGFSQQQNFLEEKKWRNMILRKITVISGA